ncbi:hypothetical protein F442_03037 [Phytophthora nicotianae P10297]|uniref:Uncharacterized protein n=1 Tax=Phytophthora nicotianae P10297 TaxID=1317064 RepID=W2ZX45_PHYNI|nr:hypothetical protein F442_03037 [Phytophthora nicotianae P10297]
MLAGIELDVSRGSLASIFRFGARRGLMSLAVAAFTSSFQRVIAHDLFGQRENVPNTPLAGRPIDGSDIAKHARK